ncbi:hypothetical protein IU405_11880 [Polaribacter sp. BAL334]|jgi:predicted transcriptional regulator|uniref:hypothetical protein n=1 Tax=Polaribacter sp. BAL334 TaxID=1708178 RepID=UPI0018D25F8A|nr:hypothetical protein [Polaribacter sp. BAL334]MBG7612947.1 hypothetical protein [Polaribacter sp. BAL334]
MDFATRKLQLLEQFMKIVSTEKIEKLEQFFKKEISNEQDVWDEMPQTVQEIVDQSLHESEEGKVISHQEVIAKAKKKYNIS